MEKIDNKFQKRLEDIEKMSLRVNTNTQLMRRLGIRPIAFNVLLARISGKAAYALFLCQLLYWHKKGRDKDWVYKSQKEMWLETQLTRSEQEGAIRVWTGLGVLEVKLEGLPQKRHYKVNIDTLFPLMEAAKNDEERVK